MRLVRRPNPALAARPARLPVRPALLGIVLLALSFLSLCPWPGHAQSSVRDSYAVLLVNGPNEAANTVLVSPDLVKKLHELERGVSLPQVGAILVTAKYQGQAKGQAVDFDAQYELIGLHEQTDLIVPLSGVQLKEGVFLDGTPVFPVAHPQGFLLPIRGKGSHQLRLSFQVRASVAAENYEIRCGLPRLAQSQLEMHWSTPVSSQQLVQCLGEERTAADPRRAPTSCRRARPRGAAPSSAGVRTLARRCRSLKCVRCISGTFVPAYPPSLPCTRSTAVRGR